MRRFVTLTVFFRVKAADNPSKKDPYVLGISNSLLIRLNKNTAVIADNIILSFEKFNVGFIRYLEIKYPKISEDIVAIGKSTIKLPISLEADIAAKAKKDNTSSNDETERISSLSLSSIFPCDNLNAIEVLVSAAIRPKKIDSRMFNLNKNPNVNIIDIALIVSINTITDDLINNIFNRETSRVAPISNDIRLSARKSKN